MGCGEAECDLFYSLGGVTGGRRVRRGTWFYESAAVWKPGVQKMRQGLSLHEE